VVVSECADSAISQSSAHGLYLSFSLVRFLEFSFFLSFFLSFSPVHIWHL